MFDKYMKKLTAEMHNLITGSADSSYETVRRCLEACLSADSEIAVPAMLDPEEPNSQAIPVLYQKDGGFWYYIAYTSQMNVDQSSAEYAVMIPIVNFLALVGSNQKNAAIAGILFNPDDDGGIMISLTEVERLMTPIIKLLNDGEPGPLFQ